MQQQPLIGRQGIGVIAAIWVTVFAVVGLTTGRITIHRLGGTARPWKWRWLHWCMFDDECQDHGCPKRLYVLPLDFYVEFHPAQEEKKHEGRHLRLL